MPKIGIIHYTAPMKAIGGVEIVIDRHAKYLSEAGYEIHLIYGHGGSLAYKNVIEHRIPLLSPQDPKIERIQEKIIQEEKESAEFDALKENVKNELVKVLSKVDTCIVHNIPSMPFNFVATAAINELADELDAKMIFWLHDSFLLREEGESKMGKFPFTLLHYKNSKVAYVVPTNFRLKQFAGLPEPYRIEKIVVVPNGVDVEEYIKIDETTKLLLKKLGLSLQDFIMVAPVRVTPRKNIELALFVVDELKHLMSSIWRIRLLVTGPPEHQATKMGLLYSEYLRQEINRRNLHENIVFCHEFISQNREFKDGEIKKWSVADVYNIADLVFIPSREEGFGLPVIEAGAARKTLFCSRIPPFQELIRDDLEGYMFDLSESPKSIAFRIYRQFLEDRALNNFDNVTKRFDWDSIISKKIIPLL